MSKKVDLAEIVSNKLGEMEAGDTLVLGACVGLHGGHSKQVTLKKAGKSNSRNGLFHGITLVTAADVATMAKKSANFKVSLIQALGLKKSEKTEDEQPTYLPPQPATS